MPPWLFWTLGPTIAALGLFTAWRALFADRSRGRSRCPTCWYDMSAASSLTCSECGHTAKHDRALRKTRRRYRLAAVAALLMLTGATVTAWPTLSRENIWHWLPTRFLIFIWPYTLEHPTQYHGCTFELTRRTLTQNDYNRLVARACTMLNRIPAPIDRELLLYNTEGFDATPQHKLVPAESRLLVFPGLRLDSKKPYTLLTPATAVTLAKAIITSWETASGMDARMMLGDLQTLSRVNPAAAEYCLDRLFSERLLWPAYFVDPRSMEGKATDRLWTEFTCADAERRSRAAACFAHFYFNMDPAALPPFESVEQIQAESADRLLETALFSSPDAELATRAICSNPIFFKSQMVWLRDRVESLSPEAAQVLQATPKY